MHRNHQYPSPTPEPNQLEYLLEFSSFLEDDFIPIAFDNYVTPLPHLPAPDLSFSSSQSLEPDSVPCREKVVLSCKNVTKTVLKEKVEQDCTERQSKAQVYLRL